MRDNLEGVELDAAVDDRRRGKKSFSVFSCIGKKTREGCGRGNEVSSERSR